MWADEKAELKENIIAGIRTAILYAVAWVVLMLPVIKAFM